MISFAVDNF